MFKKYLYVRMQYISVCLMIFFFSAGAIAQEEEDEGYRDLIKKNAWVSKRSGKMTSQKKTAFAWLDKHKHVGADIAAYIWHHPELGLGEHKSSAILQDFLRRAGFSVLADVAGQETGFVATWGNGKPVIGINAEFDALPGISQVKGLTEKKAILEDAPGHGCGHNLFGAYSCMAAIAVKEAMKKHKIEGTIKVYGTPAEETLVGKTFFVKQGIYNDADIVISWHPGPVNGVNYESSLAMDNFKVRFKGIASHAASAPWEGRSALDAVELMSIGMNYMREHIKQESRIMSCITDGGLAPNVVPPMAEAWYFVRNPRYNVVKELMAWTEDIAQAASMMSQTQMEFLRMTGAWEYLPNNVLARVGDANARLVGAPKWTDEDQKAGESFSRSKGVEEGPYYADEVKSPDLDVPFEWAKRGGSIDEANISWIVPMVRFSSATLAKGIPGHSWQQVASNCMPQAFKGSLICAKYMAATALDLCQNQKLISTAKAEHERNVSEYGPFEDPVKDLAIPSFELMHGKKEDQVPKQWEKEPYPYPETLKKYKAE